MGTERSHYQEYCPFRQGISPQLADWAREAPINIHCGDALDRLCKLSATIEGAPEGREYPNAAQVGECAFKLAGGYAADNIQLWPGKGIVADF